MTFCLPSIEDEKPSEMSTAKRMAAPVSEIDAYYALVNSIIRLHSSALCTVEGRELHKVMMMATVRFGYGTPFQSDETLLPVYKYQTQMRLTLVTKGLLYSRLHDVGCYRESAPFYRDWMEALLSEGSVEEAVEVVNKAVTEKAEPAEMLPTLLAACHEENAERLYARREQFVVALADESIDLLHIIKDSDRTPDEHRFTFDEFNYFFSTLRLSEIFNYMGAATASPDTLPIISGRVAAIKEQADAISEVIVRRKLAMANIVTSSPITMPHH